MFKKEYVHPRHQAPPQSSANTLPPSNASLAPAPKSKLKSSVQRALRASLLATYPLLTPYIDEIFPKKSSLESVKLGPAAGHAAAHHHDTATPPAADVRGTLYVVDGNPLFFQVDSTAGGGIPRDLILPHLKLVHRYPKCFPSVRVDRGALRYVLTGAAINAPGFTSKGGRLPVEREVKPTAGTTAEGEEVEGANDPKVMAQGVDEDGHWSRELEKGEPVVVMGEGKEHACAVGVLSVGTKEVKGMAKGHVIEETHFLGDGLWRLNVD